MTKVLLISKNPMLAEFIAAEDYLLSWYNDDLKDCHYIKDADVIVFDSFSYGVKLVKSNLFDDKPVIIIDSYNQDRFVSWLTNERKRGYLLIDNFLEDLQEAIECVKNGGNYVTPKVNYSVT